MMVTTAPNVKSRRVHPVLQAFWYIGCVLTLGYAPKYLRQIEEWQVYDPSIYEEQGRAYSINANRLELKRSKQQKEWDRLMIPLSIIMLTGAVANSTPSPVNSHWLSTALYAAAFGLSLEGLLLTTYLAIFKSSSAGTIVRLANGKSFLMEAVGPIAIVTALPAALTTYAGLFLLGGFMVAIGSMSSENIVTGHKLAFQAIGLAPVCITFVCLVVAVIGCEVFIWKETRSAQMGDAEPEGLPLSVEKVPDGRH